MSRRTIAALVIMSLCLLLICGPGAIASEEGDTFADTFTVRDGEIYDAQGRIAYFRGVNVSGNAKVAGDHLPFQPEETVWWDYLRSWGFNLVRFTVFWEGIEPEKGRFDRVYINKVKRLLEKAASRKIYVMVDMHQDLYSRYLHGDGAPAWAVRDAGVDPYCNDSFGGQFWGVANVLSSDVRKCFTNFWKSDELKRHYKNALVELARSLKDNPFVLGYDIYNEPMNGNISNQNGEFENGILAPFFEEVISEIRRFDGDAIGFIEPSSLDMTSSKFNEGSFKLDRLVYAPHMYDAISNTLRFQILPSILIYRLYHSAHVSKAEELKMPMWVGEFGVPWTIGPEGAHDRMLDASYRVLEEGFTSNALWDFSVRDVDAWNEEDYSLIDRNGRPRGLKEAARPYVRRLNGEPVRQSFDVRSGKYVLEFRGERSPHPTVVYVPEEVQYPAGFRVLLSDGVRVFMAGKNELLYFPARGGSHRLTILPR